MKLSNFLYQVSNDVRQSIENRWNLTKKEFHTLFDKNFSNIKDTLHQGFTHLKTSEHQLKQTIENKLAGYNLAQQSVKKELQQTLSTQANYLKEKLANPLIHQGKHFSTDVADAFIQETHTLTSSMRQKFEHQKENLEQYLDTLEAHLHIDSNAKDTIQPPKSIHNKETL